MQSAEPNARLSQWIDRTQVLKTGNNVHSQTA